MTRALVVAQRAAVRRFTVKDEHDDKLNIVETFAKWMAKQSGVVTKVAAAKFLATYTRVDVTESILTRYITMAREYLEHYHGKTLWNVRGEGWRVATEKQKAIMLVRSVRTTVRYAQRSMRLRAITKPDLIAGAVGTVVGSYEQGRKLNHYMETFTRKGLL